MKKLALLFCLICCSPAILKAQQTIDLVNFKDRLGKTETLCDVVYSIKIVSDTLTLINMGGAYPNQKYTVAIKGNKLTLDWINLKNKRLCVTGVLQLYKNTLQINAFEPNQVVVNEK